MKKMRFCSNEKDERNGFKFLFVVIISRITAERTAERVFVFFSMYNSILAFDIILIHLMSLNFIAHFSNYLF